MTTSNATPAETGRQAIREQAGREYRRAKAQAEATYLAARYGPEAWSEAHHLARREGSFHGSCCPDRAYYWHCACSFMGYTEDEFEEHLKNPEDEED